MAAGRGGRGQASPLQRGWMRCRARRPRRAGLRHPRQAGVRHRQPLSLFAKTAKRQLPLHRGAFGGAVMLSTSSVCPLGRHLLLKGKACGGCNGYWAGDQRSPLQPLSGVRCITKSLVGAGFPRPRWCGAVSAGRETRPLRPLSGVRCRARRPRRAAHRRSLSPAAGCRWYNRRRGLWRRSRGRAGCGWRYGRGRPRRSRR